MKNQKIINKTRSMTTDNCARIIMFSCALSIFNIDF